MVLLEKILEYDINCPVCNSVLKISDYLYEIPFYGKIIISSGVCSKCKYKWSDVRLAESKGPVKIKFKVSSVEDLNTLVIKSSTCTIKIPDLGAEIIPGYDSHGYITTIEGIILSLYEKVEFMCSSSNSPNCLEKLDLIKKALNGEIEFTIELIDPMGVSKILSEKSIEEIIEKHEDEI
ncbi:MAG: ZPR1 zinc finger domain-containing protein [Desulfurococcaceae archaeon]|uniref:ZPR1 zinc finger domain-containing protein n=1 Tax=Staphylothermus marinus TaxID=2280 RepID=A0A7C4DA47_STAMA